MEGGTFSGEFLKPLENFSVQHLDHLELNRVVPEVFFGLLLLAIAGLVVHFLFAVWPARKKKKGRQ